MLVTIIARDYTSRVLDLNHPEFIKATHKDSSWTDSMVRTIEPNLHSYSVGINGSAVKRPERKSLPEKLGKKMRVKNSQQASKELFDAILLHNLLKYDSITIKSRFGTIKPKPLLLKK